MLSYELNIFKYGSFGSPITSAKRVIHDLPKIETENRRVK